jgi:hypothetical protein
MVKFVLRILTLFLLLNICLQAHFRKETNFSQMNLQTDTNMKANKLMDYFMEYEGVIKNPNNVIS